MGTGNNFHVALTDPGSEGLFSRASPAPARAQRVLQGPLLLLGCWLPGKPPVQNGHLSAAHCEFTVGPPKNISVTPGKGSLVIHFSPPFDVFHGATFQYLVHYWEKSETQQEQVEGPFKSNSIVLGNLKPYRVYCLQTEAQLILKNKKIRPHGLLSNVSCHETTANASARLQQVILIPLGIFALLLGLTGACFTLFLKYQSRVKYWFQAPPNIPEQIEEYLKDPDQFILEVLDKDGSPKEDSWDSVSIISSPEKERDDVLQTP